MLPLQPAVAEWQQMDYLLSTDPERKTVKRWMPSTDDGHKVNRRVGGRPLTRPGRLMAIPIPPVVPGKEGAQ